MKSFLRPAIFYALALAFFVGCVGPQATKKTPDASTGLGNAFSYSNVQLWKPPASGYFYHKVAPKETLYSISKEYGVTIEEIMQANHLKDATKISKGSTLLIPRPGGPSGPKEFPPIPLFPDTGRWKYIIVHHTVTKNGDKEFIDRLHKDRGFGELGYHFVIDNGTMGHGNGEIEIGPRWYKQTHGAHTRASNMNEMGIGIALIGDFSKGSVPSEQLEALTYLVNTLRKHYGIPRWRVLRHRDVRGAATECPGDLFPWSRFKKTVE